jgi:hypothetical protein
MFKSKINETDFKKIIATITASQEQDEPGCLRVMDL